jgi:phage/plasmid-associated DNA primase
MEAHLLQCVNRLPDGALTDNELRHVKSHRGCKELLYSVARTLMDERFADKLDSNLELFALDNVVVNAKLKTRGPVLPESNIQTTAGWTYDAALAEEYRGEVETFFARVMPVEEERRALLSFFASALSGKRVAKKILVLTDRRAGNNGKSTLVALMRSFFGAFSATNTKFVCAGSFQADRNAHDAGLEPFRTTRLIVAEELKNNMALDAALLKMLSGGANVMIEGRKFGQGDRFKFVWQANIVLIFNEGDCPKYDSGDTVFVKRLVFAPMRSKFVSEMPAEPEEHTFLMDGEVSDRFPLWRSALLDLLLEHFDPRALDKPPEGMLQWGHAVTTEANPLADWMQQHVKITGERQDFLLFSDIVTRYKADVQLARQMSVTEFKKVAKAYLGSVALSFKAIDNIKKATGWSSAPNVAKGVILITMA